MKNYVTKNGYSIIRILYGRSNAFLISLNGKNILVDTGPGMAWIHLKNRLNALNIKTIDYLILTHTHYDHAENAAKIKSEFGASIIVNTSESSCLEKGESTNPGGTNFLTHFLIIVLTKVLNIRLKYDPCTPDILVDNYFKLNELGFDGYILHTPGHSSGSQSIIIDNEIAIVGDAMFGIFPGSVFPPFADDEYEMIRSWGKLLKTNCRLFLPSHGTENSAELVKSQYIKWSKKLIRSVPDEKC